jgi:sigma-B regulation protein RsbU (phosphoserine phosphatase)
VELDSDPLGIFGGAILQRTDIRVFRGDRFFMYSDGLIESSPGAGRREGVERLVEACVRTRALPLSESANAIVDQVGGGSVEDDLLLLAAEVGR